MESDDPQGSGDARAMLAAGDSMSIYFGRLHSFAHPRGLSGYFQFAKNVLSQCLRERLTGEGEAGGSSGAQAIRQDAMRCNEI